MRREAEKYHVGDRIGMFVNATKSTISIEFTFFKNREPATDAIKVFGSWFACVGIWFVFPGYALFYFLLLIKTKQKGYKTVCIYR